MGSVGSATTQPKRIVAGVGTRPTHAEREEKFKIDGVSACAVDLLIVEEIVGCTGLGIVSGGGRPPQKSGYGVQIANESCWNDNKASRCCVNAKLGRDAPAAPRKRNEDNLRNGSHVSRVAFHPARLEGSLAVLTAPALDYVQYYERCGV